MEEAVGVERGDCVGVKVLPPLPVPKGGVSVGVREGREDTEATPLPMPVPDPAREGLPGRDTEGEGEVEVVPTGVGQGMGLPVPLPDPPPLVVKVGGEDREASGVPLPSAGEGEAVVGMEAVTHCVGVGGELRDTAPPVGDTAGDGEPF